MYAPASRQLRPLPLTFGGATYAKHLVACATVAAITSVAAESLSLMLRASYRVLVYHSSEPRHRETYTRRIDCKQCFPFRTRCTATHGYSLGCCAAVSCAATHDASSGAVSFKRGVPIRTEGNDVREGARDRERKSKRTIAALQETLEQRAGASGIPNGNRTVSRVPQQQ
jgi:hypothetical protein